jgi:predicted flap endonuclease-1-like 5' DNA nuclease
MGSTSGSDIFGGITFIVIVALAVAAIAVMIYGRYLKQRRLAGEKDLIERRQAAHVDAVVIEPDAPSKESETAPADIVEDMPVAAAPAPKAAAKPRAATKAEPAPKVEAAPKAKVAPRAKAAAKPAVVKAEPAPKAKVTKAKAPAKAAIAAPAAPAPEAKPAPKAKAAPKAAAVKADAAPRPKAPTKAKPAPASKVEPVAKAEPVAAPSPSTADGDITQLKGLGPKLATTLAELGYTRLDQIAALTPAQASELDAKLGAFQGRMARDRWIEQATLLVAGDRDAYEAAFGKLG